MNDDEARWALDRHAGRLQWGGCSLPELAREHGTPLYVVNTERLAYAHGVLRDAFKAEGLNARFFFSFKTNPVPAVLRCIRALGCGAEVISPFEYWLASELGFHGADIVVNGTWKSPELLRQAVMDDVALLNVESLDELRAVRAVAADVGRQVKIGLRINPCLRTSPFDFTLSTGSRASHSGFRKGERDWDDALRLVRGEPIFDVRGLHFHIGSGVHSVQPYIAAIRTALTMWTDMLDADLHPTILDIGGGFATSTVREFNLLEAIRFFGWRRPPELSHRAPAAELLRRVAGGCAAALESYARERGVAIPVVFLEPGRSLVASSQLLLLKIATVRSRPGRIAVAVCDAGAMSVSPLLLSERHVVLPVNRPAGAATQYYDIVGNLPTPLDIVALRQKLPTLSPEDLIAVMDVGAYFTALGNTFGGPRPPIVLIDRGVAHLVRKRETFREMVTRDLDIRDDPVSPRRI